MWPGLCPPIHCIWVLTIKLKFGFWCHIKYEETGYLCWSLFSVPYHRIHCVCCLSVSDTKTPFCFQTKKIGGKIRYKRCSTCKRALAKVGITISQSELVIRFKFKQSWILTDVSHCPKNCLNLCVKTEPVTIAIRMGVFSPLSILGLLIFCHSYIFNFVLRNQRRRLFQQLYFLSKPKR